MPPPRSSATAVRHQRAGRADEEHADRSRLRGRRRQPSGRSGGCSRNFGRTTRSSARRAGATEGTSDGGAGAIRWIVDPLDGTINYLYGIPAFAVSVACEDADGTVAGIVLDPIREERFAATRSGPPTLNGEPITAGAVTDLSVAMVATGFGYDAEVRARQADILRPRAAARP